MEPYREVSMNTKHNPAKLQIAELERSIKLLKDNNLDLRERNLRLYVYMILFLGRVKFKGRRTQIL